MQRTFSIHRTNIGRRELLASASAAACGFLMTQDAAADDNAADASPIAAHQSPSPS